jgi:hypothetical protein
MFTKPTAGWSKLKIKDFSFPVSYTTDVPNDLIKAISIALKEEITTVVTIDGEDKGMCKIILNMEDNFISILCSDKNLSCRVEQEFDNVSIIDFASEVLNDLIENQKEWLEWALDEDSSYSFDLEILKNAIEEYKDTHK